MSTYPEHLHQHGQLSELLHFVDEAEYVLQSVIANQSKLWKNRKP